MERRSFLQLMSVGLAEAVLPAGLMAGTRDVLPAGNCEAPAGSGSGFRIPEKGATLFNAGWRFHKGDIPTPKLIGQGESYGAAKAGGVRGAAADEYDERAWEVVNLPHDWAIEAPPVENENPAQGYRERGFAWYRLPFLLDAKHAGRYLEIQFGAIATNATIWFNGNAVAHNWSGYNGIYIDITSMARFGGSLNNLVVRVDADAAEGWWYEGAGIYRDVWFVDRSPVGIVTDGVHADPRLADGGRWRLPVEATLYSIEEKPVRVQVVADLMDACGRIVASSTTEAEIAPLVRQPVRLAMEGIAPRLWSVDDPHLYTVRTRVIREGQAVDERMTPCGFRSIHFDANNGFFLNGAPLKIKGVCIHQDHAGVGVAVPPALVEWRMRRLKEMGCNAVRPSHNAPDAALLHACDRLGIMVMDENRNFNVSPDYIEQLEWLVRRDRNHPSVIMWSVFNEEPIQGSREGYEMVRRMVKVVKALDDARPVTAAMNGGMFEPVNVSQAVDLIGFNYLIGDYDPFHKAHPTVPMISSENTSAYSTRGAWKTAGLVVSSEDREKAGHGETNRAAWKAIDTRPFVAGGFTWTGFDYHGEASPQPWPANSSLFGTFDLCGFRKASFYLHRAMWLKDRPLLDILPHWNWAGEEGKPLKVMIATNLDRVQLRLNGKVVGDGVADPYDMITFEVPYAPGKLEARGWRNGRLLASTHVQTTGAPVRLRLTPDRGRMTGDGVDCQPITIEALDARGRPVPTASNPVTLAIEGGRIIGVGNGDPTSIAASKGSQVRLFNGLAQVIVQTDKGGIGRLTLSASAENLRRAPVDIVVAPA